MIFVFATDDRSLVAFATESDAVISCEGIDVANNVYKFFNENGSQLQARFAVKPKTSGFVVSNGVYELQPGGEILLQDILTLVASVEGLGLGTIEQVKNVLNHNSSGSL